MKKKASKKKGKKKDKDLTPDRTTESLFEELVLNGIIKTYPEVRLKEFLGEISYTGMALKAKAGSKDPEPGGGDVRRAITEYCILPMSKIFLLNENTALTAWYKQLEIRDFQSRIHSKDQK